MSHPARREHRVEVRGPVVEAGDELPAERIVPCESRLGDLVEDRRGRAAAQVLERVPLDHAPGAVGAAAPPHLPAADPFGAAAAGRAGEIEADRGADERIRPGLDLDAGDQKLRHPDRIDPAHERGQLLAEGVAIEDRVGSHRARAIDLELRVVAERDLIRRRQPAAPEVGGEQVGDLGRVRWPRAEEGAQPAEAFGQLLGGLLLGERVVPGLEVAQHRLERRRDAVFGAVVVDLGRRHDCDAARAARQEEDDDRHPGESQLTSLAHCGRRGPEYRPPCCPCRSVSSR